jgi:hypothetical protein
VSEETRRVLDLLAQNKITADEAEQLLKALGAAAAEPPADAVTEADRPKARWVRINVHKTGREGKRDQDVNIRVPIAIVKSGMRLGALIPGLTGDQISARMREKGLDVDFTKLDAAAIDSVLKSLGDTHIDIDDGRSQVRITCE